MLENLRKPDLALRLVLFMAAVVLRSPVGSAILSSARRLGDRRLSLDGENWLEINLLKLQLPRLDPAFNGYRLAQISDFHIGTWADRARLIEAIDRMNELKPDLVAITGDFVTHQPAQYASDLVEVLQRIQAPDGRLAVLGNHDYWSDPVIVRKALRKAGVIELNNQVVTIGRGTARVHFAGVDDVMEGLDDLPAVLDKIPSVGAAILLAHEPDFADNSAACERFELQISGHTHGGQVNLPRIGPLVLPRLGRKYPSGYYRVNGMHLYTNRGLGTAELEIRYRCPAEITLFELYQGDLSVEQN
jgi:hypothetical protein